MNYDDLNKCKESLTKLDLDFEVGRTVGSDDFCLIVCVPEDNSTGFSGNEDCDDDHAQCWSIEELTDEVPGFQL